MKYHNNIKKAKSRGHIIHLVFFAYFKELSEQNWADKAPAGLIRFFTTVFRS